MSAVITSIAAVKEAATEEGFRLFCEERGIDPDAFAEPEEGVMIDSFDLLRYGMATGAANWNLQDIGNRE